MKALVIFALLAVFATSAREQKFSDPILQSRYEKMESNLTIGAWIVALCLVAVVIGKRVHNNT